MVWQFEPDESNSDHVMREMNKMTNYIEKIFSKMGKPKELPVLTAKAFVMEYDIIDSDDYSDDCVIFGDACGWDIGYAYAVLDDWDKFENYIDNLRD